MPELPEVETVCRVMRRVLVGHRIKSAEVAPDSIVLGGTPPSAVEEALVGRTPTAIGRKGKYWWLEFKDAPWVFGHLGMSGWVREIGGPGTKLKSHGKAAQEEEGVPRFLKLLIETEEGRRIAFTDGRRLGRLWLSENAESDPRIQKLGFDSLEQLPDAKKLHELLVKRKAPLKAILLDQGLFAGVGNWVADEVLYQAHLAPKRLGNSLSLKEVQSLRSHLHAILTKAVEADADYEKFPETWLFHHRWGGGKGAEMIGGEPIVRETVGGRTTAWVPSLQK